MKILLVSMNSIHFRRWTSQLEDAGHEVYWFDALGAEGYIGELPWVHQKTDWRLRIKKGRYTLKKIPGFNKINERNIEQAFENYLLEINPDIVHSFVLYMSCFPILEVMRRNKHISWVYSAWGNDLYFYQHEPKFKKEIEAVLPELDYMFADCQRDINLAYALGFKGKSLGVFPGGGGYHLDLIQEPIKAISERKGILVKGYQGEKHRGLQVLKALEHLDTDEPITFFSTDESLLSYYCKSETLQKKDITFYTSSKGLTHKEFCCKMNASLIYIGNNVSDGMPNTLLEAICFGAFPIQSNPGGASAEVIKDGLNGLLIPDCENIKEIRILVSKALDNTKLLEDAFNYNFYFKEQLEYYKIRENVFMSYESVKIKQRIN